MPLGFNAAVQMRASGCELPTLPGEAQYWTSYFTSDSRGGNAGSPGQTVSGSITFTNAGTLTASDSRFTGNPAVANGCSSGAAVNGVGCWYFDAGAGVTDRPTSGAATQGYHETRGGCQWIYWSCDGSTWSGSRDYNYGAGYSGLRQSGGQFNACGSCSQSFTVSDSSTSAAC